MRQFRTVQLFLVAVGAIVVAGSGCGRTAASIQHDGAAMPDAPASTGGILGGSGGSTEIQTSARTAPGGAPSAGGGTASGGTGGFSATGAGGTTSGTGGTTSEAGGTTSEAGGDVAVGGSGGTAAGGVTAAGGTGGREGGGLGAADATVTGDVGADARV